MYSTVFTYRGFKQYAGETVEVRGQSATGPAYGSSTITSDGFGGIPVSLPDNLVSPLYLVRAADDKVLDYDYYDYENELALFNFDLEPVMDALEEIQNAVTGGNGNNTLNYTVLDQDDNPVHMARITLSNIDSYYSMQTDISGQAILKVVDGDYNENIYKARYGNYVSSFELSGGGSSNLSRELRRFDIAPPPSPGLVPVAVILTKFGLPYTTPVKITLSANSNLPYSINGGFGYAESETKKTDSSGIAVFYVPPSSMIHSSYPEVDQTYHIKDENGKICVDILVPDADVEDRDAFTMIVNPESCNVSCGC